MGTAMSTARDHSMSNVGLSWKTRDPFPPVLFRSKPATLCESIRATMKPSSMTNRPSLSNQVASLYTYGLRRHNLDINSAFINVCRSS
jgi:hypothetical protein